jgi:hypothetical protein
MMPGGRPPGQGGGADPAEFGAVAAAASAVIIAYELCC